MKSWPGCNNRNMAENDHLSDNLNMSDDSQSRAKYFGNGINWDDAVNSTGNSSSGKDPKAEATYGFFDRYIDQIPLLFYPGSLFYLLHGLALMSLSASVMVSFALIVYQCSSNRRKARTAHVSDTTTMHTNVATISGVVQFTHQARQADLSFMKWNISERLVMYLAVADLCTGISHMLDHIYIVHVQSNPPDLVCSVFAFILHGSFIAQWIVVTYTAVNACSLIVFNKRLHLGRMDWRLVTTAVLVPVIVGAVDLRLGLLGQSGAWCFIDIRTQAGLFYGRVFNTAQMIVFLVVAGSYGAILVKIRQSTKHTTDGRMDRYRNSARIMMIFVLAFILQYWINTIRSIWSLFAPPHGAVYFLIVLFINLGGVYNSIAYTLIRRRFTHVAPSG